MLGCFARSLSGHDRDCLYIIVEETEKYVYLSDGRYKPAERPKKKNKKHIGIIKKISFNEEIVKKLSAAPAEHKDKVSNEEIKRAIKLYKENTDVKG